MGRAPCCDKANVKKGPWSPEEDNKLKDYIHKHGTGGNWISLPQKAGLKRCGKSCRLRWLNYLRPNIKHGEFSDDEDKVICSLFANIGSRWSIIAAQLPGRTDNDIKNYWNTKLKKKLIGLPPNTPNKMPINNPLAYPQASYSSSISSSSYSSPTTSSSLSYLNPYDQISIPQNSFNINNNSPNFSIIKGEEGYDQGYIFNGVDENQNLMIPNCGLVNGYGERQNGLYGEDTIDYSCLEEIKQLISTNCSNSDLNLFADHENKIEGKIMYF